MNRRLEAEALRLTHETIARFWQLDIKPILSLAEDDIMWVMPEQERYMRGIDAMRADLKANLRELVPCHMSHVEFTVVQNCGRALSVVGRYLVTTDAGAPIFLQVQQRTQVNRELVDDRLVVKSLYISHPRGELAVARGETFANAIGRMAKHYLDERVAAETNLHRVPLRDANGTMHLVSSSDVVFVEARRKRCLVRTTYEDIDARMGITDALGQFPELLAAHRSYLVNPRYIRSFNEDSLSMSDGTQIPLPRPRRTEVLARIREITGPR